MSFLERYIKGVRFLLPTPFTIALLLTIISIVFATIWPWNYDKDNLLNWSEKSATVLKYWYDGLWNTNGLAFAIQMMLMLLLGHVLALSPIVDKSINRLLPICRTNSKSAFIITLFTLIVSWFNWGLGLVFGAIFCKKVMQYASENKIALNSGLIGAAGYCGLMIWHGGISGSSLIKISEPGHLASLTNETIKTVVPNIIGFRDTVFSTMNLIITLFILLVIPTAMYWLGRKVKTKIPSYTKETKQISIPQNNIGAEKIDNSKVIGRVIGGLIFSYCILLAIKHPNTSSFQFINPNFLNLMLLGLGIFFHGRISNFLKATEGAIGGTAGILIQFPLYFGIMGIFKSTGIISDISYFFQSISNEITYPIYTFISAGIVNFFVPSGGGQWYIQGPLVIESALEMGIPLDKCIMALAYGDQLTNMMQPFWALPLLGITGLKAKDILPYTFIIMLIGFMVFCTGLLVF
jgi:short-chain fatty acids transporter